jgi:hypothetical protein
MTDIPINPPRHELAESPPLVIRLRRDGPDLRREGKVLPLLGWPERSWAPAWSCTCWSEKTAAAPMLRLTSPVLRIER